MKKLNWGNVEAASEGYAAPPAGGYVLAICSVEDHTDKEYLKIYCDIAGVADKANEQFVGYYGQRKERSGGKIPLFSFIRSYRDSALRFFKAFLVALEKSGNSGFVADYYDGNEQQFCGMVVGAVLGEEEYTYNGKLRMRLNVEHFCSVERIQKGDFKIPELKKEKSAAMPVAAPTSSMDSFGTNVPLLSDEEIPF
jgi:hypothetical protein